MKPEAPAASVAPEPTAVLHPLREGGAAAIAGWYGKAILLAGSLLPVGDLFDSTDRQRTLILEAHTEEPAGVMAVALDNPEPGWATVTLLAIAAQEQRDLAAEAIALLEARLRGEASHIRAAVPLDVGLALYFWLRLGYRPVVSGQRLWMMRDLDA